MMPEEIAQLARDGAAHVGELERLYQTHGDELTAELEQQAIEYERSIRGTIRDILVKTLARAPSSVAKDIQDMAHDGNPRSIPFLILAGALVRVSEGGRVGRVF